MDDVPSPVVVVPPSLGQAGTPWLVTQTPSALHHSTPGFPQSKSTTHGHTGKHIACPVATLTQVGTPFISMQPTLGKQPKSHAHGVSQTGVAPVVVLPVVSGSGSGIVVEVMTEVVEPGPSVVGLVPLVDESLSVASVMVSSGGGAFSSREGPQARVRAEASRAARR